MKTPLPIKFVNKILLTKRRPVAVAGFSLFLPLILLFTLSGAIYPDKSVVSWGDNPLEATGLFLMLAILPAYLLMCFVALHRSNNATFELMDSFMPEGNLLEDRYQYARFWPLSVLVALAFGIIENIGWDSLNFTLFNPLYAISVGIVIGQLLLWFVVGIVMYLGLQEGIAFHKLGKKVPIDLYNLDELNGFGQAGLNSFLMIVGALAITALQSLDQVFRMDNYLNALYVCIPAVLILVPLPIWSLHRRIVKEKKVLLADIAIEIMHTSRELEGENFHHMNALLERRDKIQRSRNWPMDLSMGARFMLYVLIPPLAWTGAALVEVLLDSLLVG
jgi:hypothetical protein